MIILEKTFLLAAEVSAGISTPEALIRKSGTHCRSARRFGGQFDTMATNTKQYGPKGVRHQRIPTMDPIARALPFFGSMPVEDILVLWQFETNTPVGVVVSTAVDVRLWCRVVGVVVGNCVEAKKRCKVAGKETCNVQQNKQDMQTCRGANMQRTQKTAN